jgi:hypothetical protein
MGIGMVGVEDLYGLCENISPWNQQNIVKSNACRIGTNAAGMVVEPGRS